MDKTQWRCAEVPAYPVQLKEAIQHILCMYRTSEKYLHLPCCLIITLWGTALWAGTDGKKSGSVLAARLPGGKCNVQTAREACQGAWSINFYLLTVFGWAHCSIRTLPKLMQRQLVSPISLVTAVEAGTARWMCTSFKAFLQWGDAFIRRTVMCLLICMILMSL